MFRAKTTIGLAAALCSLLAVMGMPATALAAPLAVEDGYVREMPPGQTVSAAFMVLRNTTAIPIAIVAATCDASDQAEIHNHRHTADGMRMEKVIRLEIPAQGRQALQPGGYHLMLIGLKRPLKAGDTIGITLLDEMGKSYSAKLPVKKIDTAQSSEMGRH
jgi:copper(I)-binding protein